MIDYEQIAKSAAIFKGLSLDEKNDLLKDGKIRYLNKKEFLFRHGDPLLNFYIVCFGSIQLFRNNADGGEKTSNILTARDIICGEKIHQPCGRHQFNAVAVGDAVVIEFPKIWLKESAKKYSEFALNLVAEISNQASMAELEAEHQAAMSATQLVACFLQKLCLIHDFDPRGFELPYSKKLIASRLGMELETFSRTLPKLKECRIDVLGSHVAISGSGAIEENVCSHCSIEEDCHIHESFKKKF